MKPAYLFVLLATVWAVVLSLRVAPPVSTSLLADCQTLPCSASVRLNEFLPYPLDGYANEWIELYNSSGETVDLSGWSLRDGHGGEHEFDDGTIIAPYGFLLFPRSLTGLVLDNRSDCVRLFCHDGQEVESYCYGGPAPGQSFSKIVDGGSLWTRDYPPSPGGPNRAATSTPSPTATLTPIPSGTPTSTPTSGITATPTPSATPTLVSRAIFLNEFLPAARHVDWDGDGHPDFNDEWVELFNAGEVSVDLGGWQLDDRAGEGARPYTIPPDTTVDSHGFVLFFKAETWVGLNDDGDEVRLLGPDGSVADAIEYEAHPGYDQSFSRTVDGGGEWVGDWAVTPGERNRAREGEWQVWVPLVTKSWGRGLETPGSGRECLYLYLTRGRLRTRLLRVPGLPTTSTLISTRRRNGDQG